jgi:hypothetical protein
VHSPGHRVQAYPVALRVASNPGSLMNNPRQSPLWQVAGESTLGRAYVLALTLTGLGVLAISVLFNHFGMLHFEWWGYIPFHLGPGSIWAKIFDSRTLDQGVYAGRELSYLVDHVDMLVLKWSVIAGHPAFISVTHVLLSIFIGVWIGWYAAHDLRLGSLVGLLLALLFWTTPFIYLHFLMRTAKILTAAGGVVLLVELIRAGRGGLENRTIEPSRRSVVLVAVSGWVMSFADRQGFYFLVIAWGCMVIQWLWGRTRVARDMSLVLFGVLLVELVYFFWIAPACTRLFWGYDPDFSFNRIPLGGFFAEPVHNAELGLRLLLQTISFTVGRLPLALVAAGLGLGIVLALRHDQRRQTWRRQLPLAALVAGMFLALWTMYVLMILRHPPLLWPDTAVAYYWIPTGALVVLGLASLVSGWVDDRPGRKRLLAVALLGAVGGNLAALPRHSHVFASGHLHDSIVDTREIRYALMHRDDPTYFESPDLLRNPAYIALREYAPLHAYTQPPRDQFGYGAWYRLTRASGAPVRFIERFGGNLDSRFLHTDAQAFPTDQGRRVLGTDRNRAELLVKIPSNRIGGEVVVRRATADLTTALSATFEIYAWAGPELKFPRWSERVELAAGEREKTMAYEIDSSHLYANFTVEVPSALSGQVVAGWRMPRISYTGGGETPPRWISRVTAPIVELTQADLAHLLPGAWRPQRALMRRGRVSEHGVVLSPGGEIWLKIAPTQMVNHFSGVVADATTPRTGSRPTVWGLWYQSGRLESYHAPVSEHDSQGSTTFQAWCAEPGGWLVIAVEPDALKSEVVVKVTDVKTGG